MPGIEFKTTPIKMKDVIPKKDIIFLHHYKAPKFIHAYQYSGYMVEGKHLIYRMKNCGQRLIDPETIVYKV